MPLMYLPLAADGFALTTDEMTVIALSMSFLRERVTRQGEEKIGKLLAPGDPPLR